MAGNSVTVHFTALPKHNPDDLNEIRRYSCSECDDDILNVNVHAQFAHDSLLFDIDPDEKEREVDAPFHPCGISGCTFAPHEDGPHSWESSGAAILRNEVK